MPTPPSHPSRRMGGPWHRHTPVGGSVKGCGFLTVGTFHRSAGHGLWESSALFDLSREERDGSTRNLVFPTYFTET